MNDDLGDEANSSAGVLRALGTMRTALGLVASAGRRELALMIALTALGALLTAFELLIGRQLVDLLVTSGTASGELVPWLILLGVCLVTSALVNAGSSELVILLSELVHRRAITQILDVATAADLEDFEDHRFHDQLRRAREHSYQYAWEVVWGLVTVLSTLLSLVAIVIVLLGIAPVLVPIAALAYVPIAFVSIRNTRALYRLRYRLTELDRDRVYHEQLLTGRLEAKEVRAFGLGTWLRRRHDELFDIRVRNTRRVVSRRTLLTLGGSSLSALILVGALAVLMVLALKGHLAVADAAVAVVALQQLSARLRSMNDATTGLVQGVTFLRDFEAIRTTALVRRRRSQARDGAEVPGHPTTITLDRLSYRYPVGIEPALVDVDLQLTAGRTVAIVGPNGAGKTTLAKLLCGLLRPTGGTIWWDEVDTARCDPVAVRRRVAPVFQDFTRYEHTAAQSIGFGDVERIDDLEAISTAANLAGADRFLATLPRGYETRLSTSFSGGTDLSVGQWQRIAIARAFFRDAPLVVMDEPASSLDARAERDLFARLHTLGRDRIVVFISHRFATVHRADHIIVLLDGRMAEQGTHDELMSLGGVYAELYAMQAEQFR